MENKKDKTEEIIEEYIKNNKFSETDGFMALALVAGLFGTGFGSNDYKYHDLDKRLSKLESKQEIIEKIILK